jgi:hypothetical protein
MGFYPNKASQKYTKIAMWRIELGFGGEAGCHSEKGGRGRNQKSATLTHAQQMLE